MCIRRSREAGGARIQYVVDQAWKRVWDYVTGFGKEAVSELGQLDLLGVVEGGGAGFCQEAFMCPVHLHRAVQGLVQIALEVANMRWVMEVAEVEEVVREDARFPKLDLARGLFRAWHT